MGITICSVRRPLPFLIEPWCGGETKSAFPYPWTIESDSFWKCVRSLSFSMAGHPVLPANKIFTHPDELWFERTALLQRVTLG